MVQKNIIFCGKAANNYYIYGAIILSLLTILVMSYK